MASPRSPWRARWQAWWEARHRPTDRWQLGQRNIYILPTRAGLAFGLTLLLLLVASINYQLSLGYALTFLLSGSALVSMHLTHASLRGLTLHVRPPAPAFAGDAVALEIVATNPGTVRHGVAVGVHARGAEGLAWGELAAMGQTTIAIAVAPLARGLHALPLMRVETRFPFGLFRAWSTWRPTGQLCVYPRPEAPWPALPVAGPAHDGPAAGGRRQGGGEFDGLRPWRRGDTLRQLAWKAYARSGELVSRDSRLPARRDLWLDWAQCGLPDTESRLSRLAAWVMRAEREGVSYGLRLPGQELPSGAGPAHRQAALTALAAWH
ncbi:DUF58 domain-containing protein [Ideonella sp.]|uniref:DUF58 domain-containing protein n=1 Tax=Ideonella sp. TaxID=1929293 RepID=UPI0035AFDBA3